MTSAIFATARIASGALWKRKCEGLCYSVGTADDQLVLEEGENSEHR